MSLSVWLWCIIWLRQGLLYQIWSDSAMGGVFFFNCYYFCLLREDIFQIIPFAFRLLWFLQSMLLDFIFLSQEITARQMNAFPGMKEKGPTVSFFFVSCSMLFVSSSSSCSASYLLRIDRYAFLQLWSLSYFWVMSYSAIFALFHRSFKL